MNKLPFTIDSYIITERVFVVMSAPSDEAFICLTIVENASVINTIALLEKTYSHPKDSIVFALQRASQQYHPELLAHPAIRFVNDDKHLILDLEILNQSNVSKAIHKHSCIHKIGDCNIAQEPTAYKASYELTSFRESLIAEEAPLALLSH